MFDNFPKKKKYKKNSQKLAFFFCLELRKYTSKTNFPLPYIYAIIVA